MKEKGLIMFSKSQILRSKGNHNNHLFFIVSFCLTLTIFSYFSSVEAYKLKESNSNQKSKPIPITFINQIDLSEKIYVQHLLHHRLFYHNLD